MNDFTAIPCITLIVYTVAATFKVFAGETKSKYIPALCGILGGLLGTVCYFFVPGCIPGENLFVSVATGIISGFSATGVNQVYKQFTCNDASKENSDGE